MKKRQKFVLYQLKVRFFYSEVMEASYIAKVRVCRYLTNFGFIVFQKSENVTERI